MNNEIIGLVTNLLKDTDLSGVLKDLKKSNPTIGSANETSNVSTTILQRFDQLEQQLIEREKQLALLIQEVQGIKDTIESINQKKSWYTKLFKK